MLYKEICQLIGKFLLIFCLLLVLPLGVSIYYEYFANSPVTYADHSTRSFVLTIIITLVFAVIFRTLGRRATGNLRRREGIFLVVAIWLISTCIGSLPFIFTKTLSNPLDAFFESTSGFTTTGASIIYPKAYNQSGKEKPITIQVGKGPSYTFYGTIAPMKDPKTGKIYQGYDAISRPILFWRSFTQWIGGMGIIIFFLSIFPQLALGGKFLFEAGFPEDFPGSYRETLQPRIQETSRALLKTYLGLTVLQIVLLAFTNEKLSLFEAVTTAFCTISTGGFMVVPGSISFFQNAATEWIVILFMICGALNFALYFYLLRGKFDKFKEPEFPFFCLTVILVCALILWKLGHFFDSIRPACFQGISALTGTGFYSQNFDIWPIGAQVIILMAMYIGGMTGSTSSGIKIARHLILFQTIKLRMEQLFRPETIRHLKIGQKEIPRQNVINVFSFVAILIIVSALGAIFFVFDGIDVETSFGLVACAINNIGFAFRAVGPEGTCAILPSFSKIVMILWMFLGRLELFAIAVLLLPSFWKNK